MRVTRCSFLKLCDGQYSVSNRLQYEKGRCESSSVMGKATFCLFLSLLISRTKLGKMLQSLTKEHLTILYALNRHNRIVSYENSNEIYKHCIIFFAFISVVLFYNYTQHREKSKTNQNYKDKDDVIHRRNLPFTTLFNGVYFHIIN